MEREKDNEVEVNGVISSTSRETGEGRRRVE